MRAHPMKRPIRFVVFAIAVIGLLALASYLTTASDWDGGFPAGEFRLNIRNADGQPVKGAILRVYHGGTRDHAFEYPLNNYLPGQMLVSDDNGRVIALQQHRGLQFGWFSWDLFWIIPIGAKPPAYDCEITADGYRPLEFSVQRIFDSPYMYPKNSKVDGKNVEVKIYEQTFVLER